MPTTSSFFHQQDEEQSNSKSNPGSDFSEIKTTKRNEDENHQLSIQENLHRVLVVATQHLALSNENNPKGEPKEISVKSSILYWDEEGPADEEPQPGVEIRSCEDDPECHGTSNHRVSPASANIQASIDEEKATPSSRDSSETSKPIENHVEDGHDRHQYKGNDRVSLFIKSNRVPSDFFNLARKFLAKFIEIDLIAMETAIIVAVDTANLLERSKYATTCRVTTDSVDNTMEFRSDTGAPIRRSRICITVRRSSHYTDWLQDNT